MEKSRKLSLCLLTATACIGFNSLAAIVINEFDYDQAGADTAEFIELFNTGDLITSLDNYSIDLINGLNSSAYRSIDLTGFSIGGSDYFVVCGDASQVLNCDYSFTSTSGWLQNGAPDAIALFENASLLDSISYEGFLALQTEGDALTIKDNNSTTVSISRIIDGMDSNNNAFDFELGCLTPGSQNIAGSGNCSVASVSAVPVPAALWLFGSGIIGVAGFARRS
ncbi:MAG TPA: lamin tail domain-containing protein [Gammaproteobacteria bacterium]|nr:lamin tail domain-containing protein [Gammaproteobacteria bacterium]